MKAAGEISDGDRVVSRMSSDYHGIAVMKNSIGQWIVKWDAQGMDVCHADWLALDPTRSITEEEIRSIVNEQDRIKKALEIAQRYGGIDGDHHKAWVIDQMCRTLAGDGYESFVAQAKAGEDGPETYSWDEGIAP